MSASDVAQSPKSSPVSCLLTALVAMEVVIVRAMENPITKITCETMYKNVCVAKYCNKKRENIGFYQLTALSRVQITRGLSKNIMRYCMVICTVGYFVL